MPATTDRYTRRNLPHYSPNDSAYFITFNLKGSIAAEHLYDLKQGKRRFVDYDALFTSSPGEHLFRDQELAQIVFDRLLRSNDEVATMHAFTVMSNHVHVMMSLHETQYLSRVIQLIKGSTARECNKLLERTGEFWQEERYDRVLRKKEFRSVLRYILNNPVKAGVVSDWREYKWTYLNADLYPGFTM